VSSYGKLRAVRRQLFTCVVFSRTYVLAPNNNGGVQERCGNHTNIARTRISTLIIWYDATFASSLSERIGNV